MQRHPTGQPQIVGENDMPYKVAQPDSTCVLLWMNDDHAAVFKEQGFAYCHALGHEEQRPLEIEIGIEIGSEFIPYRGARNEAPKTRNWRAKIRSAKLLTQQRLTDYLEDKVPCGWKTPTRASHYLLFEFDAVSPFVSIEVGDVARANQNGSRFMAFTCKWRDLLPDQLTY